MNNLQHILCVVLCLFSMTSIAQSDNYSTQITALTTSILEKTNHLENAKIGIVDFTNIDNSVTALGKLLAEEISGEMSLQNSVLTIIDRSRVNYWLQKENVSVADLSNPTIAERISKKANIDFVLLGNITTNENITRLNLKVMNLKTGAVVAYERKNIELDETLLSLIDKKSTKLTVAEEKFTKKSVPAHYDYTEETKETEEVITSKEPSFNPKDASELPHKTEINNLEFKLRACKRANSMVSVFFTITNKSGDITLKIDDNGVLIQAPEIDQLALTNFRFNEDISIYVERTLTTGVPVQVQLIFNNVPADMKIIDKLVIDYYAGRNEQFEVQNIVIE